MATRLWVGGLEAGIAERDLEDEVDLFGKSATDPALHSLNHLPAAVLEVWQTEECMGCTKGIQRLCFHPPGVEVVHTCAGTVLTRLFFCSLPDLVSQDDSLLYCVLSCSSKCRLVFVLQHS